MSAACRLQMSQMVDPFKTARYAVAKEILAPLGKPLL
jgi:hypothetical protein